MAEFLTANELVPTQKPLLYKALSLAAILIVATSGCATGRTMLKADLSAPGWRVRQGQAVWRPSKGKPEIAGELMVATRGPGEAVVQLMKPPFPLVLAQISGRRWQIQFGPQARTFSGEGTPPARLIWLYLTSCLEQGRPPPKNWTFHVGEGGQWHFENSSSGEMLEGYLSD